MISSILLLVGTGITSFISACCAIMLADSHVNTRVKYKQWKGWIALPLIAAILGCALAYHVSIFAPSILVVVGLCVAYVFVVAAAIYDFKLQLIPNAIPLAIVGIRILFIIAEQIIYGDAVIGFMYSFVGGAVGFLVLYVAGRLSKGGIGGGDIKLVAALGFLCGFRAMFTTLTLALLVCALFSIPYVIAKKERLSDSLPFGPFIYVGFIFMLLLHLY